MNRKLALLLAGGFLLISAWPVAGHHSFSAEFDAAKPVKFTGVVTKVDWQNPHVWFYIDVKSENGAVTNWGMELGSPNSLMRSGWTRNSMKIGNAITVEGSRARDGTNNGAARIVILTNTGQRLFGVSSQGAGAVTTNESNGSSTR